MRLSTSRETQRFLQRQYGSGRYCGHTPDNLPLMVDSSRQAVDIRRILGRISFGQEPPTPEETPSLNEEMRDSAIAYGRGARDKRSTLFARILKDHPPFS